MEESSVESTVAPKVSRHGKSCVHCARAKVKCTEKSGLVGVCERCHRLAKDCQPITRVKRRKSTKRTTAAKTAELEQKLDGIVSLLTAATQVHNTPSPTVLDQTEPSDPKDNTQGNTQGFGYQGGQNLCSPNPRVRGLEVADTKFRAKIACSTSINSISDHYPLPGLTLGRPLRDHSGDYYSSPRPTAPQPISLIPTDLILTSTEEENVLYRFRTQSTKYLPFIFIPPDTNVHEFKKENPFWWLTIVMTTAKTTSLQTTLGMHIRHVLGQKLLVLGERNLDLLWGLLTYIAWYESVSLSAETSMDQYDSTSYGVVYDLGLNKAPPKKAPSVVLNFDARGCPKPFQQTVGSLQEKRALLCLFSLSSSFSLYVQRIDTLRWTPYAEESAKILSENPESFHDVLMVQIVRLQLIQERVKDALWYNTAGDNSIPSKAPASFYLKALKNQMDNFKQQIPKEVHENATFLLHLYNTELTIHEIALSKEPVSDMADFQRLESLCICFQSVKSWFDLYFSLPRKEHASFIFPIYMHLAHCMVALYRLSIFEDPQWDVQLVRQQLDLSFVLDRIIKGWENDKNEAGLDKEMDRVDDIEIFATNAKRVGLIKTWWDAKVVAETSNNVPGEKFANASGGENMSVKPMAQAQAQAQAQALGLELPTFEMNAGQDFWNDGWWQDVFGSWGTQGDMVNAPGPTHF